MERPSEPAPCDLPPYLSSLNQSVVHGQDPRAVVRASERRARLHRAVADGAGALVSHCDDEAIISKLADAYANLIGARLCAIALVDRAKSNIRALATRGTPPLERPIPLVRIPASLLRVVEDKWARELAPLEIGDHPWLRTFVGGSAAGAARYLLAPLVVDHDACGAVLLGFEAERRLEPEETLAVRALAEVAAAVLARASEARRQSHRICRLEAVQRFGRALDRGDRGPALVRSLRQSLEEQGVEVVSVAFSDPRLARRVGAEVLPQKERRHRISRPLEVSGGVISVPMITAGKTLGALRLRACRLDDEQWALLISVAEGLAGVVSAEQVRQAVVEAGQQRAVAAEQERLAQDLHDSVGQLASGIRLMALDLTEHLPEGSDAHRRAIRLAELGEQAKRDVDHAIRGLTLVPSPRRTLAGTVRDLARAFSLDSGIDARVLLEGSPVRLDASIERALFRVAHEALANAWRHSGARRVDLTLAFRRDSAVLRVTDDGVGPGNGLPRSRGMGIDGMRQAVRRVGGHLEIGRSPSGGAQVEASVPWSRT